MIKKLNSFTILVIVTIVMSLLMLMTIQRPRDNNEDYSLLFPALYEQLGEVDTITFNSSQDQFTLFKQGEDWFVKERWDHLADFNLVKRALIDIADAKILERKTSNPEYYELLGVEGAEGSSVQVTMFSGEQEIAGLILGKERELGQGQGTRRFYVRRAGEEGSWLAEGYLNINPLMLNWIKGEVMNISRERITQVNIIQPNGETATIVNLGQKDKFGTPEMGAKTVFKYNLLGYDIASTLYQLRMEDVQPLDGFSREGSEVVTAEFITFDGLKITTETSFIDGYYFTTFFAESDQSLVTTPSKDIIELGVLKTPEEIQQEVDKFNKELTSWVYRFGGFVGTNLMRAKADMVTTSGNAIPMPADMMGVAP
jgi:hypothetical protein